MDRSTHAHAFAPTEQAAFERVRNSSVEKLGAHVVDVHVDAGVDVVEQIPAGMVGVLVYHEVIATVPAPIGTNRPVPRRNFKVETARHPKAMTSGSKRSMR